MVTHMALQNIQLIKEDKKLIQPKKEDRKLINAMGIYTAKNSGCLSFSTKLRRGGRRTAQETTRMRSRCTNARHARYRSTCKLNT